MAIIKICGKYGAGKASSWSHFKKIKKSMAIIKIYGKYRVRKTSKLVSFKNK